MIKLFLVLTMGLLSKPNFAADAISSSSLPGDSCILVGVKIGNIPLNRIQEQDAARLAVAEFLHENVQREDESAEVQKFRAIALGKKDPFANEGENFKKKIWDLIKKSSDGGVLRRVQQPLTHNQKTYRSRVLDRNT